MSERAMDAVTGRGTIVGDTQWKPGQVVALVGLTGAGKTTLVSLIPRFYNPTSGRVLVDGFDLNSVTSDSLRSQMGSVQQNNFLFTGTVLDNAFSRRKRMIIVRGTGSPLKTWSTETRDLGAHPVAFFGDHHDRRRQHARPTESGRVAARPY